MIKKRLLTGIQPTGIGSLHLGNYCGPIYSIKKALEKKVIEKKDIYVFIADLHSMTVKTTDLKSKSINTAKSLYAFDLTDNIYIQSDIKSICEGAWFLSQFTTTGEMNRMTQFKDKQNIAGSTIGLYTYPILMAADILFMNATHVPVGEDQMQHMEITGDICRKVNHFAKKDIFVIPEMYVIDNPIRIMSLNDSTKKMSKSMPEGCLFLTDNETIIRNKIKKAETDSLPFPSKLEELEHRQAANNLITIYSIVSDRSILEVINQFHGVQWSLFKNELTELLVQFILDFQRKFDALDDTQILQILSANGATLSKEVDDKLKEAYSIFM